jgi:uncharacterized membrane protein YuzA (DUF378 family)
MKTIGMLAWWLVVIGAINWGLMVLGFNLVEAIFSFMPALITVVYALVGLSGVYVLLEHFEIV